MFKKTLLILIILFSPLNLFAENNNQSHPSMCLMVNGDYDNINQTLTNTFREEIKKRQINLVNSPQDAPATLWIFSQKAVANKNSDLITIAIVHTSTLLPKVLALQLSKIDLKDQAEPIHKTLSQLFQNQPLDYVNIAILDDLQADKVQQVAKVVVDTFIQKEM